MAEGRERGHVRQGWRQSGREGDVEVEAMGLRNTAPPLQPLPIWVAK